MSVTIAGTLLRTILLLVRSLGSIVSKLAVHQLGSAGRAKLLHSTARVETLVAILACGATVLPGSSTADKGQDKVSPYLSWSLSSETKHSKTLVLDLDDTLVYSTAKTRFNCDAIVEVYQDSNSCVFHVSKRPHLDTFLRTVSSWYKIVIFTASLPRYAEAVINYLDSGSIVSARYFRDSCVVVNGEFVKDLRSIGQDLSKTILIDNSPAAYSLNPENAIPIAGWSNRSLRRDDDALLLLLPFLEALRFVQDVRSILSLRLLSTSTTPRQTSAPLPSALSR
mmetsp:Transcript_19397/g.33338  ORF Transcript_19397/g.33338 Transcript_19397/m.33338 type:complete len:281 (+) Transcript_19397:46-888(+)|eukprot:CAMPEP_0196657186 /NCGR_PEP_ID=MMETSP1086-20130531/22417_1 /TAXON_ID=77921 /ORGANISM="Cyanoptyche  gloeocystis , Strain SAG4.97" /LENGTH=280 /DNA_ID=CAMNT_0041990223 /DNA_START=36 /DNA_END=878 /DNA_ORIENTATION=+